MTLIIKEHKSSSYAPRTYHNASVADVTIALAVDHNTAGEKCTQKAVGAANKVIVKLDISDKYIDMARLVYKAIKNLEYPTINIAGNGIYTLQKQKWSQEEVNRLVYDILNLVNLHKPVHKVVCGGQTGVDLAGAVAAYKLGIDCEVTMPKGFKMRFQDGKDCDHEEDWVRKLIVSYADNLKG